MNDKKEVADLGSNIVVAGAISGCVTRCLSQPLDVIKIRFQLQVEPITKNDKSKYHSILQAFKIIHKEEGIFALWKGHISAQLLSIVYGMSQFYAYNISLKFFNTFSHITDWKHSLQFISGANAGAIATIASFPFDTIRTRLVAQSNKHKAYNGIIDLYSNIIRHESLQTFYYGLSPTLIQIALQSGLQFAFYGVLTDSYKKLTQENNTSSINSLISGSFAGVAAKTIVYPFDLSKKRLQIQGFKRGRKGFGKFFECNGLIDCIKVTLKNEGYRGLFKGILPSQLKAAVTTALHFTVYEQTLVLLTNMRN